MGADSRNLHLNQLNDDTTVSQESLDWADAFLADVVADIQIAELQAA